MLSSPFSTHTMASTDADIEKSPGAAGLSGEDGEKPQLMNIEDVEEPSPDVEHAKPQERLSRFTSVEEEAVIRALDWHLMPLIFTLYSISVLDRSNLGNAKIAGMEDDIDLSGNRYAWLGTIFYISCQSSLPLFEPFADNDFSRYSLSMDPNGLEGVPSS
jgi:hypothetical protein